MNRKGRWWLTGLLLMVATSAAGTAQHDYAWQWPLAFDSDDSGAYRVVLDESVYRRIRDAGLADVAVLDPQGAAVPSSVLPQPGPGTLPLRRVELPWFPLPMPTAAGEGERRDWQLLTEVAADGSLRRISTRIGDSPPVGSAAALLVDLSELHGTVSALELEWKPVASLDVVYRVEASNDLDDWYSLPARGRMVDLRRDGQRLLQRRVQLDHLLLQQGPRYLRLLPEHPGQAPEIVRVRAELAVAKPLETLRWLELEGRRSEAGGQLHFEYTLEGRFPIEQLDAVLPGNHAVRWQLESRDDPDADWRLRAGPWMAYRVDAAGRAHQSPAQALSEPARDRYWRLRPTAAVSGQPQLRLGYRPEALVFLAPEPGAYVLVAGSARPPSADTTVRQLVADLRRQQGGDWQPSTARLGEPQVLAGEAALTPRRDWTAWVLWAVLIAGALVVVGLAVTVLRNLPPMDGA